MQPPLPPSGYGPGKTKAPTAPAMTPAGPVGSSPAGYTDPSYQVPLLDTPNYGDNPWAGGYQNATEAGYTNTEQANQNIGALQGQMGVYGGDGSKYPAMQNSYGLGDTGPTPGTASNPNYLTQPMSVTMPDSSSRGFNPWSLQGESNARGR